MSDGVTNRQAPTRQSRTRRKGAPRGGRHGLSRATVPVQTENEIELTELVPPRPSTRTRRVAAERPLAVPALSREAEMAYVRADMRKLLVISGGLLALMLVIMVLIGY